MVNIDALAPQRKASGTMGRLYRPSSLTAAAELMRGRVAARYPVIGRVGEQIKRSGFAFAVDNGRDAVIYKVKGNDDLSAIRHRAVRF